MRMIRVKLRFVSTISWKIKRLPGREYFIQKKQTSQGIPLEIQSNAILETRLEREREGEREEVAFESVDHFRQSIGRCTVARPLIHKHHRAPSVSPLPPHVP